MAQINITIPDAVVPRVLDAVAAVYGYNAQNGQTKAQFAKSQIIAMLKNAVHQYEGGIASDQARTTADAGIDTTILLS